MAHPPASLALSHLRAELDSLWSVVHLRVRQLQQAGILPPPGRPRATTAVSPVEVEARLTPREQPPQEQLEPFVVQANAALAKARATVAALEDESGPALPLVALRRAFGLDPRAYTALIAALAPEVDPKFPRLYAYLQNHFERQYATVALVADCFGEGDAAECQSLLDPAQPLLRYDLLQVDESSASTPSLQRAIRPDPRILRFVLGDRALDLRLAGAAELLPPLRPGSAQPILPAADAETWTRLAQVTDVPPELRQGLPTLVLRGPDGVGKRLWASHAAQRLGQRLLVVELDALRAAVAGGELLTSLRAVLREGRLLGAMVALEGWDAVPQEARSDVARAIAEAERLYRDPMALLVEDPETPLPETGHAREVFELSTPDHAAAVAIWARHLPEGLRGEGASPERLARAVRATPGRIESAVGVALEVAAERGEGRVDFEHLADALRAQLDTRLGTRARRVTSHHGWDALIVPPDVEVQLKELCHRHRYRGRVLQEWGLGRRFGYSLGLSALFDGPPGTGKTMAAGIIARDLGLDLYQIDLSQVVSKYIGETEKNLSVVFDEAERSGAMLLFDEADSLFSKRTSVSNANDRYANLEVNYLLQRIERFGGVAILTTNFSDSIDSAFARRLSMRVKFPAPGAEDRERLWRSMLNAPDLPLAEIDYPRLAADYELAGGLIRNAVLRAAFLAASREVPVDQQLLSLAARIEMHAQGMLVRGNPHQELT